MWNLDGIRHGIIIQPDIVETLSTLLTLYNENPLDINWLKIVLKNWSSQQFAAFLLWQHYKSQPAL